VISCTCGSLLKLLATGCATSFGTVVASGEGHNLRRLRMYQSRPGQLRNNNREMRLALQLSSPRCRAPTAFRITPLFVTCHLSRKHNVWSLGSECQPELLSFSRTFV
jgi:hypothetical protein